MNNRQMQCMRAGCRPHVPGKSAATARWRAPVRGSLPRLCILLGVLLMLPVWSPLHPPHNAAAETPNTGTHPPADESDLVTIPGGQFIMGYKADFDTEPVRHLSLPAYAIDKYEVTNKRYKRFIDATGHHVPWSQEAAAAPYLWDWKTRTYPSSKGDDPVVLVSWQDAMAFCAWAGKSLPTEEQWEKAARGTNGEAYPWGNQWLPGKANTAESNLRQTASAGAFTGDVSAYGVHDLAGNVSEWVVDWFNVYPGNTLINYDAGQKYRVLRGGSWDYAHSIATGYHRQYATPQSQMAAIGFRCVKAAAANGKTAEAHGGSAPESPAR